MDYERLVEENYDNLNETDKYIARFIENNIIECCDLTIEELASLCNVSRTTLLRFAKKLGFGGFSEFKFNLKFEAKKTYSRSENDIIHLGEIYKSCIDEIIKTDYTEVFEMIHNANKIYIFASGYLQDIIVREFVRLFMEVGICVIEVPGLYREYSLMSKTMTDKDLCIIISNSGETDFVIQFAKMLKLHGTKLISMTALQHNTLSSMADETIYVSTNKMNVGSVMDHETMSLFFVLLEFLNLKYKLYVSEKYGV